MDPITLFLALYSIGVTVVALYAGTLVDKQAVLTEVEDVPDATFDHRGLT